MFVQCVEQTLNPASRQSFCWHSRDLLLVASICCISFFSPLSCLLPTPLHLPVCLCVSVYLNVYICVSSFPPYLVSPSASRSIRFICVYLAGVPRASLITCCSSISLCRTSPRCMCHLPSAVPKGRLSSSSSCIPLQPLVHVHFNEWNL